MAYNYFGLNNPGNIGYGNWAANHGGLPSSAFDTGHAIASFPDLNTGYGAMSSLALGKYNSGATSLNQLIAGPGGWTPGNYTAASNIANTMGISPNADLQLTDPSNMSSFQRALTLQETGSTTQFDQFSGGGADAFPGTAQQPLPGLTAWDYGVGSNDFSAGTGSIGQVNPSDLSPGIAGPQAQSFNSQYGFPSQSGLSDSGFAPIGDSGFAQVTPSIGTGSIGGTPAGQYSVTGDVNQGYPGASYGGGVPDTSTANAGTGQYSGVATTNTSPSTYGGSGTPVTPGPGMPVSDQGLATGVNNAGTSISQAISNPLSGSIKTAGSDVTQAGQTVSSGVNQAANTVSSTGVGILAGIEKYVGEFFLYGAVLVVGVIFLAIGLSKFGGPKVQVAHA